MEEVVPGVFLVKNWGSNAYIIPGEKTALIDAGFPVDAKRIHRCCDSAGGGAPRLAVLTHYHLDHAGAAWLLKRRGEMEVAAHEADAPVMEGSEPYELFRVDALRTTYYRVLAPLFRYRHFTVDRRLLEGDVVDILGGLEVIHIPGHTRGSIALFQRDRGLLFSGDSIRNENGVIEGPPPQFSPGLEESFWNIAEKILGLDYDVLLPGHGEPVTGDAGERVRNMMIGLGRWE